MRALWLSAYACSKRGFAPSNPIRVGNSRPPHFIYGVIMAKIKVNLWKINKYTKKGEAVIVQGKVLGEGLLEHPVSIAAESFSESAKKKIKGAGGKIITKQEAEKAKAKLMK